MNSDDLWSRRIPGAGNRGSKKSAIRRGRLDAQIDSPFDGQFNCIYRHETFWTRSKRAALNVVLMLILFVECAVILRVYLNREKARFKIETALGPSGGQAELNSGSNRGQLKKVTLPRRPNAVSKTKKQHHLKKAS